MATIDLKIQNRCDHRIQGELVTLRSDKRTLVPKYVIASEGSVGVLRYNSALPPSSFSFVYVDSLVVGEDKAVYLSKSDKTSNPLYYMNYATQAKYCPKCLGTGFTDDLDIKSGGDFYTMEGLDLLAQNVEKNVIIDEGSNPFHRWIGNRLRNVIGKKNLDINFIETEIRNQVKSGLSKFKNAQGEQADANPYMGIEERLDEVISVVVTSDDEDPTIFRVQVDYTSLSGKNLRFNTLVDVNNFRIR